MAMDIEEDMSLYEIDFLSEDVYIFFKGINPKTIIRLGFSFEKLELEYSNYIENKRKLEKLIEESQYEKCYYDVYIKVLEREDGEKLLKQHFKENKKNYREMRNDILSYRYDLFSSKREANLYDERKNFTISSIEREFNSVFPELKTKYPILEKIGLLDNIFEDEQSSLDYFVEMKKGKIVVDEYFKYLSDMIYKRACEKLEEIKESQSFGKSLEEIVLLKKDLIDEKENNLSLKRLKEMFLDIFSEQKIEEQLVFIKEAVEKLNKQKSKTLAAYKESISATADFNALDESIKLGYIDISSKKDRYEALKKEFSSLYDKKEKTRFEYNDEVKEEEKKKEEVTKSFSDFVDKIIKYMPDFKNSYIFKNKMGEQITLKEFVYSNLGGLSSINYHTISDIIINAVFSQIDDEISKSDEKILTMESQIYEKVSLLASSKGDNPEFVQLVGNLFSENTKKVNKKTLKKVKTNN